jgi:hypothetical protein
MLPADWSSDLRSRLRNQWSQVQIPVVSRGFCDEQLHLLTSHGSIPEGVAVASQIFLRDAHVLPK